MVSNTLRIDSFLESSDSDSITDNEEIFYSFSSSDNNVEIEKSNGKIDEQQVKRRLDDHRNEKDANKFNSDTEISFTSVTDTEKLGNLRLLQRVFTLKQKNDDTGETSSLVQFLKSILQHNLHDGSPNIKCNNIINPNNKRNDNLADIHEADTTLMEDTYYYSSGDENDLKNISNNIQIKKRVQKNKDKSKHYIKDSKNIRSQSNNSKFTCSFNDFDLKMKNSHSEQHKQSPRYSNKIYNNQIDSKTGTVRCEFVEAEMKKETSNCESRNIKNHIESNPIENIHTLGESDSFHHVDIKHEDLLKENGNSLVNESLKSVQSLETSIIEDTIKNSIDLKEIERSNNSLDIQQIGNNSYKLKPSANIKIPSKLDQIEILILDTDSDDDIVNDPKNLSSIPSYNETNLMNSISTKKKRTYKEIVALRGDVDNDKDKQNDTHISKKQQLPYIDNTKNKVSDDVIILLSDEENDISTYIPKEKSVLAEETKILHSEKIKRLVSKACKSFEKTKRKYIGETTELMKNSNLQKSNKEILMGKAKRKDFEYKSEKSEILTMAKDEHILYKSDHVSNNFINKGKNILGQQKSLQTMHKRGSLTQQSHSKLNNKNVDPSNLLTNSDQKTETPTVGVPYTPNIQSISTSLPFQHAAQNRGYLFHKSLEKAQELLQQCPSRSSIAKSLLFSHICVLKSFYNEFMSAYPLTIKKLFYVRESAEMLYTNGLKMPIVFEVLEDFGVEFKNDNILPISRRKEYLKSIDIAKRLVVTSNRNAVDKCRLVELLNKLLSLRRQIDLGKPPTHYVIYDIGVSVVELNQQGITMQKVFDVLKSYETPMTTLDLAAYYQMYINNLAMTAHMVSDLGFRRTQWSLNGMSYPQSGYSTQFPSTTSDAGSFHQFYMDNIHDVNQQNLNL